jgi:hypothetical protein
VLVGAPALAPPGAAAVEPTFSDVPLTHPHYEAVEGMAAAEVINGFTDGSFGPDLLVTRQQFAKMIVLTLALPVSEQDVCGFPDVYKGGPDTLYPDNYVAVAAKKGITTGYTDGRFGATDNIRRSQISTMMVRAADNLGFRDLADAPDWFLSDWGITDVHGPSADTAQYSGLFEGLTPDFYRDPYKMATRGEVAQLLWNLKTFVRQTRTVDQLVTVTDTTTADTPGANAFRAALEAVSGGQVEWMRSVRAEHPVNASVVVYVNYGCAGGTYYSGVPGPGGQAVVAPLVATFLTYLQRFGAEVGYAYFDLSDPQDPQVASVFDWRLGGDYLRQDSETLEEYTNRIQPLMDEFLFEHGDEDGMFFLSDPDLHDLVETCDSLRICDPGHGLLGVRFGVDLYRACGTAYGDLIEQIADEFWPW